MRPPPFTQDCLGAAPRKGGPLWLKGRCEVLPQWGSHIARAGRNEPICGETESLSLSLNTSAAVEQWCVNVPFRLPRGWLDAARALLARGITGHLTMLDGKTGIPRTIINIEKAAQCTCTEGPHGPDDPTQAAAPKRRPPAE